ncbi:MAG: CBS and ACT domain-containing protein [Anaerolineales bacterium]
MSSPVITVSPEASMPEAFDRMHKEHIRRLPVVNKAGELVGIVAEADLLKASPSEGTTLSIHEMKYLLSRITVAQLMTKPVITITENTPLEDAARIMVDCEIGGLPVMCGSNVVGIITETTLFRIFMELLGARKPGMRVTAEVPDTPGELARLAQAIYERGGNIVALGTFQGDLPGTGLFTFKVDGITREALEVAIHPFVDKIIDIRSTSGS